MLIGLTARIGEVWDAAASTGDMPELALTLKKCWVVEPTSSKPLAKSII
jgi:hypothetical protein